MTRRALPFAALLLAACDLAAGLDGYTFVDPPDGAGGEGGAGGAAAECTTDASCPDDAPGDCLVSSCDQGACAAQPAAPGAPCDHAGGDVCDASGTCRKSDGRGCEADIECLSNACVDHVCCQSSCDGACLRCDAPSARGLCTPEPTATDCGMGLCDGTDSGLCHHGAHRFSGAWGDPMDQRALGIAFDSAGNAWVGGYLEGTVDLGAGPITATAIDAFLLKLDATGTPQIALQWPNTGYQAINEVAVDGQGHVLAVGTYAGNADFGAGALTNGGNLSVFLLAFDETGAVLWQKDLPETNDEQQGAHVAVVPGSDDVVIAGHFKGGLGGLTAPTDRMDVFAMRFDAGGALQWERSWGSPGAAQRSDGLDVDAGGNVYLTGQLNGSITFGATTLENTGTTLDAFVAKLDPAGEGIWAHRIESPEEVFASDVAVAPDGRVFVAGNFLDTITIGSASLASASPAHDDLFLAVFAADGTLEQLKRYGDAAGDQYVESVAIDAHGNVALTGRFESQLFVDGLLLQSSSLTDNDLFLVKLAPDTTPLWGKAFGAAPEEDGGLGVAFSPTGDVALVGALRSTADFGGMSLTSQGEADLVVACFAP